MATGVMPFNPSAYVMPDTSQATYNQISALQQGVDKLGQFIQKQDDKNKRDQAPQDPAVQQMLHMLTAPTSPLAPPSSPGNIQGLIQQATGAAQNFSSLLPGSNSAGNQAASTGATSTGGLPSGASSGNVPPAPMPALASPAPIGASSNILASPAVAPAAPALATRIQQLQPAVAPPAAAAKGPQSAEAMDLMVKLAPYLAQRRAAQDAAGSREEVAQIRGQVSSQRSVLTLGGQIAAQQAKIIAAQIAANARLRAMAAKPQDVGDLNTIRQSVDEAQKQFATATQAINALEAAGLDVMPAGERSNQLNILYQQRDAALKIVRERDAYYQQALDNFNRSRGLKSNSAIGQGGQASGSVPDMSQYTPEQLRFIQANGRLPD